MKILAINPISFKKRMIEFLFDYLFILAYLGLLFLSSMPIYIIFFNGVPEFTEIQSQWLVFFTSVGNSVIWARFMAYIVILMYCPLSSLFRRLSSQFPYWQ